MSTLAAPTPVSLGSRVKRFMSDYPIVPLLLLLALLILGLQLLRPGIINARWAAQTLQFAIPLALLAGCQTMTMLTGGIDMSVGTVASVSAFVLGSQVLHHEPGVAVLIAMAPAVLVGLANGIGIGIFRVHPLIMTLGTGLIAFGGLQVYQRTVIATGFDVPPWLEWLGTGLTWGLPNSLFVFAPLAALIIYTLRFTGFGRLLYAIGDNEKAARLSGVEYWKVILALYLASSLLAGIAGLLFLGLIKTASLTLVEPQLLPSVAAAVIGGTSIFGGRGGYVGTIVGVLILRVIVTMLTLMQIPEGARMILFGAIVLFVTAAYLRIVEDR
ncbi:MAG TPA: ABC transporter permease [Alphaproteobacteria bacterium]|nr:ABC transporter permease [Alphaproteobacteria bacterium]